MNIKSDDFLKRLLATFAVEAQEHAKAISSGMIALENAADTKGQADLIETIFREAHSLKGAARSVGNSEIEAVCHSLENIFSLLKRKEIDLAEELFDLLHQGADLLQRIVSQIGGETQTAQKAVIRDMIKSFEDAAKGIKTLRAGQKPVTESPLPTQATDIIPQIDICSTPQTSLLQAADTIRIAVSKLESLLRQAEDLIQLKLSAGHRLNELMNMRATLSLWKKKREEADDLVRRIRESGKDQAMPDKIGGSDIAKLSDYIEYNDAYMRSVESGLALMVNAAAQDERMISIAMDALLEGMRRALMLPFSSLFEAFPVYVRDIARQEGKQVRLTITGDDIEIDRRILEEMKDSFNHLIRNCVDHGLEKPAEREKKGKPPQGLIAVSVSPKEGNKVEVVIADDGAGIDFARLKSSAMKLGVALPDALEKMDEQSVKALMFHSGLSTSSIVTSLSGRGIGLAIVREKVEKLGGNISVETTSGQGTRFILILPMTIATFRVVVARMGESLFAIPTMNIEMVARVKRHEIKTVENRETMQFDGQAIPLLRLADVIGLPSRTVEENGNLQAVVINFAENRIAFGVDEIITEQEAFVKGLGKQLKRVENIAGVTVLGSGKIVPVLNVPDIIKSAVNRASAAAFMPVNTRKPEQKQKSILVVEDSITARTLLKNILELAGYDVRTAVDGMDALTMLKAEDFDLVVSDVEMPRMNGFDLTKKIRDDRRLAEMPVIIVTSLESREDREAGIDAGANAYIVKSSFDQGNLIGVIKRFI
ncbi:MAG: hybrid sensor histidine kinase/response regulator [Syntrophus sp. (in: bacteria)]|nr:hybrid sensor histidine kinase/response regulator [Syntrophus sp. (in: bacteria)]